MTDLFRVSMSPNAATAITNLFTADNNGRTYIGQGKYTDKFEQALTRLINCDRNPLGVNSCSAALDLALHLTGVGPGDEVISTPITCTATSGAIVNRGANIIWADVDPLTGNIDPKSVDRVMGSRTKAVIAVDWAGRSCNFAALRAVTNIDVPIIEDAAHCLYIAPNHGDYVCWSFGPIKHLTCGGYGGALLPPHEQYARAKLLRWHGLDRESTEDFRCSQDIKESGYRYHMTDDQAVIGLANLDIAQTAVYRARENAAWYCQVFKGVPGIKVPEFDPTCNYWIFTILVDSRNSRDELKDLLSKAGIGASQVHARNDRHTAFRNHSAWITSQDGVDYFDAHQLSIPVGWWVTQTEREHIAATVIAAVAHQPVASF